MAQMRSQSHPMRATRDLIDDAVGDEIQANDPGQHLRACDFQDVLDECVSKVLQVMGDENRSELADNDRAFIAGRVREMVMSFFMQYEAERCPKPTRFKRTERVVCLVGGDQQWSSGTIAAVNEADPEDPSGRTKIPYVVKLDAPAKLISVPADEDDVCRAEVCFGQRSEALRFTLFSLPSRRLAAKKRFSVGERVACAGRRRLGPVCLGARVGEAADDVRGVAQVLHPQGAALCVVRRHLRILESLHHLQVAGRALAVPSRRVGPREARRLGPALLDRAQPRSREE